MFLFYIVSEISDVSLLVEICKFSYTRREYLSPPLGASLSKFHPKLFCVKTKVSAMVHDGFGAFDTTQKCDECVDRQAPNPDKLTCDKKIIK